MEDTLRDPYGIHSENGTSAASGRSSPPSSPPRGPEEAGPSRLNHPNRPPSPTTHSLAAQEDDEEVAEHEKDRFYSLLNVDRDASEEQIRDAYRSLAIACHPDKHNGEAAKAAAQSRFHEIQKAYDVLSDRDKRNVYDYFGEDGLNSTWSISLRGRSPEELRREYERQKAIKRVQEAEELVNSKGEYTAQIDATALFAPPLHVPRPRARLGTAVTLNDRWQRVGATSLSGRHGFETGITPRMGVKLSGEMLSRNGVGTGALYGTLRNVWGSRLQTETTMSLMGPNMFMLDAMYTLDEFT